MMVFFSDKEFACLFYIFEHSVLIDNTYCQKTVLKKFVRISMFLPGEKGRNIANKLRKKETTFFRKKSGRHFHVEISQNIWKKNYNSKFFLSRQLTDHTRNETVNYLGYKGKKLQCAKEKKNIK